jgi:lipoate-protein ligase B
MKTLHLEECLICNLGVLSFPEAMEYEHSLLKLRFEEKVGDVLLIFEHPPTVTLGRSGNLANVLVTPEELEHRGISFFESDRAGDATFNCPGQLVIHPVMDVSKRKGILRGYVTDLEEVVIRVLTGYDIPAARWPGHHGIWVDEKQIGAIGLRINRGVSMHGLSLNVNPDLEPFKLINLCGITGKSATSMEKELGHIVRVKDVTQEVESSFSAVFQVGLRRMSKELLHNLCFESGKTLEITSCRG